MRHRHAVITLVWLAVPVAFARAQNPADAIYHGGSIITIDEKNPTAEAVAVRDGKIIAVGKKEDVLIKYKIPKGEFIVGYGYDSNVLSDNREMTAEDLDRHFTDNPVMVQNVSLHGAVLNSVALKKYQITAETPTPKGGVILRKPGTSEPARLLMETAFPIRKPAGS